MLYIRRTHWSIERSKFKTSNDRQMTAGLFHWMLIIVDVGGIVFLCVSDVDRPTLLFCYLLFSLTEATLKAGVFFADIFNNNLSLLHVR